MFDDTVTEQEVLEIHGIPDDSTRNNEITMAYHHLSEDLAAFTGSPAANWCAWAKWTSKTIGVGIRWGEIRSIAHKRVDARSDRIFNRWAAGRATSYFFLGGVLRLLTWANHLASRRLADGNRDVFYEVGTNAVRMMDRFGDESTLDRAALDEHLAGIESQDPAHSLGPAPIDDMRAAVECFVLARFATSDSIRDQRVLAANIHLAAYEQLRLQHVVEQSLWAPVDFFFRPFAAVGRRLPRPVRGPLGAPLRAVRRGLRVTTVWFATRFCMVVVTKDEVIRLGRPLRPGPGSTELFPPPYDHPTCSHLTRACDTLLGPVDVTKALARVWTVYPQRVRFTVVLFRSRHLDPSLREVPMDVAESTEMVDERLGAATEGQEWVTAS